MPSIVFNVAVLAKAAPKAVVVRINVTAVVVVVTANIVRQGCY